MIPFLLAATLVATFPIEHLHDPRALPATGAVRDVVTIGEDAYIVATGPDDEWDGRSLFRIEGERATPLIELPPTRPGICRGAGLFAAKEGSWWYTRCNDAHVEFVTSSAPSRAVTVPGSERAVGLSPITGDEPAGVLLSIASPSELLISAHLVTSAGSKPLGQYERTGHLAFGPWTSHAHRLEDGAIALVTLEEDGRYDYAVMLRVFRDGEMTEHRLPFENNRYVAIASATSEHGMAVVASKSTGGGLVSMVFDPNAPGAAKPVEIDGSDAQSLARNDAQMVPLGKRFAVAWMNGRDHSVRLSELDRDMALPAVVVAAEADNRIHGAMLQWQEEGVSVFWSKGTTLHRRLPAEAAGYLVAAEIWRRLSD